MAETFVEAALNGKNGSGMAYFFLADHYVMFSWGNNRTIDGVHPISEWGLPVTFAPTGPDAALDAALNGKEAFSEKAYFFKEGGYMRYNWTPPALETPVPLFLSSWNLPGTFVEGVNAAFNGKFSRRGKVYFFKENQYVRYNWNDTIDMGYPRPISNMIGIPAEFASGIDAAVDGDGPYSDYGYMFQADRYLRFDWNSTGGEPHGDGPPVAIQGNWPGLVELLCAGKAKAQALVWLQDARMQLVAYIGFLEGIPYRFDRALMETALSTHFHIDPGLSTESKQATLFQILSAYNSIEDTLGKSPTTFRYRTDAEANADGSPDIDSAYTFFNGTINFTRNFPSRGPLNRAASVMHECVHVFDNQSGNANTHIPEWYVTDAVAATLGLPSQPNDPSLATRYDLMTTANALHNPSSYAAFAQHIHYGMDTRYGEGHHDL
jgi:hypothetical protein